MPYLGQLKKTTRWKTFRCKHGRFRVSDLITEEIIICRCQHPDRICGVLLGMTYMSPVLIIRTMFSTSRWLPWHCILIGSNSKISNAMRLAKTLPCHTNKLVINARSLDCHLGLLYKESCASLLPLRKLYFDFLYAIIWCQLVHLDVNMMIDLLF